MFYNYRLLMRSTHDHEDRVRYWLTDAVGGGQPIPDKVFMVMSRPKSEVYYCFIKLSGISFTKIDTFIILKICLFLVMQLLFFLSRPAVISLAWLNIETPNTPLNAERLQRKANATPLLIGRKQNHEYTA